MSGEGKSVKVKCATWDQVEAFYTEKLRGNVLVVKMPFRPGIGEGITVALGLPDGLVFAIDGTVIKIGADDAGRVPVALRLHGLTLEVRAQLKRLVAQGRGLTSAVVSAVPGSGRAAAGTKPPRSQRPETIPPAPEPRVEDVAEDEKAAFAALQAMAKRLVGLPAHEVLDVAADADLETARAGYLARSQKLHPDVFRRYRSPALHALASEVFLHVRSALERMLGNLPESGWLIPVADGAAGEAGDGVPTEAQPAASSSPYENMTITQGPHGPSASYDEDVSFTTSVRMKALTAEELFDEESTESGPPPGMAPPTGPPAGPPAAPSVRASTSPPRGVVTIHPRVPTTPPVGTPAVETAPPEPVPEPEAEPAPPAAEPVTATVEAGREALTEGRFREACETFAAILRNDARNRSVRALYHVASGLELRAKGDGVRARLQFETALAHDRECVEAQQALVYEPDKKGGLFKRLFDR